LSFHKQRLTGAGVSERNKKAICWKSKTTETFEKIRLLKNAAIRKSHFEMKSSTEIKLKYAVFFFKVVYTKTQTISQLLV